MSHVFWGVHTALAQMPEGEDATILVVADSWFWYPIDNLATEITEHIPAQNMVVIGFAGSEAAQWSERFREQIDFGFKMYAKGIRALILSGGGNDVAGMADFLRLLREDCSGAKDAADCFRENQPDGVLSSIMHAYIEVILRFRAYSNAPVFMHNYDNVWPTGKGFFGPADWLKKPMDKALVPDNMALRRDLFKLLINRLHDEQLKLKDDVRLGPLVPLKSAGTLPEGANETHRWWANELHPTPAGFGAIARKVWVPALSAVVS